MRPDTSAHREPTTCKACGEIIPAAAKKCSHCGSFQSWRAYFPFTQSILALLVALVSVVSMGVPIIKTALQADDSVLTLTYIDRADIAIPIVASNKGTRPGVLEPIVGLKISVRVPSDGSTRDHIFLATATNSSRENLFLPENASKQFFFAVNHEQPLPGPVFEKLAGDIRAYTLNAVTKCTVAVSYLDFSGKRQMRELVLFDAAGRTLRDAEKGQGHTFYRILGASECIGKIPQDLRHANGLIIAEQLTPTLPRHVPGGERDTARSEGLAVASRFRRTSRVGRLSQRQRGR